MLPTRAEPKEKNWLFYEIKASINPTKIEDVVNDNDDGSIIVNWISAQRPPQRSSHKYDRRKFSYLFLRSTV